MSWGIPTYQTMHNYQEIDKTAHYNWREERLEIAQSLGFKYISESIVETYRKTHSATVTGRLCGDLSSEAICQFLHKIGEPTGPLGGFRQGDRRWGKRRFTAKGM